jgi:hypothetical protein
MAIANIFGIDPSGDAKAVAVDESGSMLTASTAPVGGGITWGAPTAVAMTGSSKNLVAANAARKGIIFWNPTGNSPAAYSLSGSVVTLAGGLPLAAGATPVSLTGAECPVGAITVIGTNTENLYYSEGT